ncbi:hypothetical protein HID58_055888 [Brassica napus]|uniref:Uncharacterized protein n=1 Tax=Brassica napus TaxID=3708 RepID=A0ABQ8ALL8_BRANA|nr:hypothetical protein HID58_055888 [Brassica napus]
MAIVFFTFLTRGDCVLSSPFVFSNTADLSSEEKKRQRDETERDERLHEEEEEDTGGKIKDRSEFVTVVTSRERLSTLQLNSNRTVPRTTTHHRSKTTTNCHREARVITTTTKWWWWYTERRHISRFGRRESSLLREEQMEARRSQITGIDEEVDELPKKMVDHDYVEYNNSSITIWCKKLDVRGGKASCCGDTNRGVALEGEEHLASDRSSRHLYSTIIILVVMAMIVKT